MRTLLLITALTIFAISDGFSQFHMRTIQMYTDIDGNSKIQRDSSDIDIPSCAFGINLNSGYEFINLVLEYDYHVLNLKSVPELQSGNVKFHELYAGLRFFPMKPTFIVGDFSLRPTFGGCYGFDLEPNYRGMLFGGIHFSGVRNVSGISLQFIYRTGTNTVSGYTMPPFWSIRCAIVFGPSAE